MDETRLNFVIKNIKILRISLLTKLSKFNFLSNYMHGIVEECIKNPSNSKYTPNYRAYIGSKMT